LGTKVNISKNLGIKRHHVQSSPSFKQQWHFSYATTTCVTDRVYSNYLLCQTFSHVFTGNLFFIAQKLDSFPRPQCFFVCVSVSLYLISLSILFLSFEFQPYSFLLYFSLYFLARFLCVSLILLNSTKPKTAISEQHISTF
jgi:hypothetical protein